MKRITGAFAIGPGLASLAAAQGCDPPFAAHFIGRSLPTFTAPVADLDNDGDPDIVTPEYDLQLQVFENLGGNPPAFDEHSLQGGPCDNDFGHLGSHVEDIDRDGDADILCTPIFGPGDLVWFENRGGRLPDFCQHPVGALGYPNGYAPHAADLDGDGDVDLIGSIYVDGLGNAIAWYENIGGAPPSFVDHIVAMAENIGSVWGADLDGDGDSDVLAVGDCAFWYENDGNAFPGFTEHPLAGDPPAPTGFITAADIDGDGDLDVLYIGEGSARPWLENVGGTPAEFVPRSFGAGPDRAYSVAPVDLNRDRRVDIVCGETGAAAVYLNQGGRPPTFERCELGARTTCIAATPGDFDLDGATDVVVRFGPELYWLENPDCVADFSNDGLVDTRDFLAFLNTWNAGHESADINMDGSIDTLDVLAFLNLWVKGC